MLSLPPPPDTPADQRSEGNIYPRYEDIVQDGRMALIALPQSLGMAVWRKLLADHPITRVARNQQGILPVLSRLMIEGGGGPVSVFRPLSAEGTYQLAHTRDARGDVSRLMLNIFTRVTGAVGRTNGPPPDHHGEPVFVGRVFGEHVCTRLFAPPAQRKVTRFEAPGLPEVPPVEYAWTPRDALLELPAGADAIDDALAPQTEVAFGLAHTDSNQHVNSLVYPRLFEDAALQRLAAHGAATAVLARFGDFAYRKPCFAGERYQIQLRAFRLDGKLGAVGCFAPIDGGAPHCYARMLFHD